MDAEGFISDAVDDITAYLRYVMRMDGAVPVDSFTILVICFADMIDEVALPPAEEADIVLQLSLQVAHAIHTKRKMHRQR